jgi:TRAP-type uncharacterized transport system fused permease subunit
MPGPIAGLPRDLRTTAGYHFASSESVIGIPMRAFGELVIGFVMFGAVLQYTGAAHFFNNLALALFGAVRGGPAKVSIFASGLMGSVSGSVVSNVLTTGVVTIPAMKRTGFAGLRRRRRGLRVDRRRADAAGHGRHRLRDGRLPRRCPMRVIALAALIPSLLYYFALFVQIDGYAAKTASRACRARSCPRSRETFKLRAGTTSSCSPCWSGCCSSCSASRWRRSTRPGCCW